MTAISCYWLLPSQWQAKQQGGPSKSNKIRTNPWPYNYRLSSQKRLLESCCFQGTFVHTPADNGLFSLSVCRDVRLGHPWLWQLPELPAWAHNQAVQIWPNVRASSPLPLVTSKPGKIPGCLFVSFCFIFKLESAQVWEASAQIREVHPPCSVSFKVNISEPDLLVLYLNHSLMQKGEKTVPGIECSVLQFLWGAILSFRMFQAWRSALRRLLRQDCVDFCTASSFQNPVSSRAAHLPKTFTSWSPPGNRWRNRCSKCRQSFCQCVKQLCTNIPCFYLDHRDTSLSSNDFTPSGVAMDKPKYLDRSTSPNLLNGRSVGLAPWADPPGQNLHMKEECISQNHVDRIRYICIVTFN